MSSKKTIIHEFDPCIYPRLLWVVKGGELEEIRKTLEFGELGDDEQEGGAVTVSAYDNANKKGGFLVWFPKASDMTTNSYWMAHEACHVALGIFDYIGSEVAANESEPFAYLVGWVFGCIDKVRKYKEVKHGCIEGEQASSQEVPVEEACEEEKENRNG